MIIKISLFVVWIITALAEGKRDGFFYNYRMQSKQDKYNMHWLFALERSVVLILIGWIYGHLYSGLDTGVFIFSLILVFSFFHNGKYYVTRNLLDRNVYKKKWWDSSTSSESILEFSVVARTFLAFVGLVGIITALTF